MGEKVVIVGGGFAGLAASKVLGRHGKLDVTVIDRRNYHLFQPLLYQVAMAGLSPAEIAVPIRGLLSRFRNIQVRLGNVEGVDFARKLVHSDQGAMSYDYLILGCGAKHSYFGQTKWEPFAPGLKTLEQATEIRRRVLMAFEMAESTEDQQLKSRYLTFVIVGGGPTGVELAGAIGEISRYSLAKDFRHIRPSSARIILIEAGDRVLSSFDPKLAQYATRCLERLGVQVWTSRRATQIDQSGVAVGNEFIDAETIVWAAGVRASSLNDGMDKDSLAPGHKAKVSRCLNLAQHPEVFIVGDQAHVEDERGQPLPGLAPVAVQQGNLAARNVIALSQGKPAQEFRYFDKGQMATIGRKAAVLEVGPIKLTGFLAWLCWLFVHIYFLIGFKNRLFVLVQWMWSYFSYARGARLIVHKEWRSYLRNTKGEVPS